MARLLLLLRIPTEDAKDDAEESVSLQNRSNLMNLKIYLNEIVKFVRAIRKVKDFGTAMELQNMFQV